VLGYLLPGAQHLQNVHPLVVHFPIAFLYGAAMLYFLAWAAGREAWAWTGLWLLALGALSAAVAVGTGLYGAQGLMVARSVKAHLLSNHRLVMIGVLALSLVLSAWAAGARPMPSRGRLYFLALLVVMIAGLTLGADFGGRMVYDYNAGGNACGQPIEFTQ
jgi:uncharacterized membrane protein